jgi:hypothetical protein
LAVYLRRNAPPPVEDPQIQGQESFMQEAFVGGWARQPHFSVETLGALHDLNHRFLDLIGAAPGGWPPPGRPKLPGEVAAQVAPLSAAQRSAAANCPFALFDLRFHDDEHWRARIGRADRWRIADEARPEDEAVTFLRLALFYAWHVASTANLAAQLILGMSEDTAAAFRGVTLNRIPSLAAGELDTLTVRWCGSAAFWGALVRAASRTDPARLRRVQLFGLQLAAAARLP